MSAEGIFTTHAYDNHGSRVLQGHVTHDSRRRRAPGVEGVSWPGLRTGGDSAAAGGGGRRALLSGAAAVISRCPFNAASVPGVGARAESEQAVSRSTFKTL